jgi:2-polyprenyl-3-methyl-5-hydroxy-6-metoxy-1,4-benzoquinol methylase
MIEEEEIKALKEKINHYRERLDFAIKENKKDWIESNLIQMIANLSLLSKYLLEDQSPSDILGKADKTINDWYFQKYKNSKKDLSVSEFYNIWAKTYDSDANLAILLEERYIKKFIKDVKNRFILDLGCGTGRYAVPLAKKGAIVTGVDFSQEMLKKAKERAKQTEVNLELIQADIIKYSSNKKFDLIISMLVCDHIKNIDKVIKTMSKASKIGTEVVISNTHPEVTRKSLSEHNKKGLSEIVPGLRTNIFYHPVSEYIELFKKENFYLIELKDIILEEKDVKKEEFKHFAKNVNKSGFIIMKFKKMKD